MEYQKVDTATLNQVLGRLRFRHISLLVTLSQHGNISLSAKHLNMSQPTASKLLREIEEIFGVQLFTRNRRGLTPTQFGTALMKRAEILLAAMEASHEEILSLVRGATARLRLGVFPVAIASFLPQFYQQLQQVWPDLEIFLREGVEHDLIKALEDGQIDCTIGRIVPAQLSAHLRYIELYDEPTALVCGIDNPLRHLAVEELIAPLHTAKWILPASSGALFNMINSWLNTLALPPPRLHIETPSIFSTIELLQNSHLLGCLPLSVATSYAKLNKIALLNTPLFHTSYPIGVSFRTDMQHTALIQTVLQVARKTGELERQKSQEAES